MADSRPDTCAHCDASIVYGQLNLPLTWWDYLREERDFFCVTGDVRIPLCHDCYPGGDILRESHTPTEDPDPDIEEFLDELDLDALIEPGVQ